MDDISHIWNLSIGSFFFVLLWLADELVIFELSLLEDFAIGTCQCSCAMSHSIFELTFVEGIIVVGLFAFITMTLIFPPSTFVICAIGERQLAITATHSVLEEALVNVPIGKFILSIAMALSINKFSGKLGS